MMLPINRWSRSAGRVLDVMRISSESFVVNLRSRRVDMGSASVCSIRSPNRPRHSDHAVRMHLAGIVAISVGQMAAGRQAVHQPIPGLLHEWCSRTALSLDFSSPSRINPRNGKFAALSSTAGRERFQRRSWSSAAGAYRVT